MEQQSRSGWPAVGCSASRRVFVLLALALSVRAAAAQDLYVQTTPSTNNGVVTLSFANATTQALLLADDFTVPAFETWTITRVRALGFVSNASSFRGVDGFRVMILDSTNPPPPNGDKHIPGTALFDERMQPSDGWDNAGTTTGTIPAFDIVGLAPLTPGRYWLSVSAIYSAPCCALEIARRWSWRQIISDGTQFGAPFAEFDSTGTILPALQNQWMDHTISSPGVFVQRDLSFRIEGSTAVFTTGVVTTGVVTTGVVTTGAAPTQESSASSSNDATVVIIVVVTVAVMVALGAVAAFFVYKIRLAEQSSSSSSSSSSEVKHDHEYETFDDGTSPPNHYTELSALGKMKSPASPPSGDDEKALIDFDELDPDFNDELGRGAFGVVFKGMWRGGVVAIKELLQAGQMNPDELAEFKAEAQTMKGLRPHVNLVQFLGYTTEPKLCIITEFLDGGSLHGLIHKREEISQEQVKIICLGTAAGMWHLHSEGLVHRDLAARNVLLTKAGSYFQPKISDFGMSRQVQEDGDNSSNEDEVLPLKWMSPEALREKIFSAKTDVWSFGITLLELVTRNDPYPGLTGVEAALGVAGADKLRPTAPATCPEIVEKVMNSCFRTNPDDRPAMKDINRRFNRAEDDMWDIPDGRLLAGPSKR